MLNIDQVQLLEGKVEKAVNLIKSLSDDNTSLKKEIEAKDKRISELENLILVFKDDQTKIEQGIISALNKLSAFENSEYVHKTKTTDHTNKEPAPPANVVAQLPAAEPKNTEKKRVENPINEMPAADSPAPEVSKTEAEPVVQQLQQNTAETDEMQKDLADVLGGNSDNENQLDIF